MVSLIGGHFAGHEPEDLPTVLCAQDFDTVCSCFADLPGMVVDCHTHLGGCGTPSIWFDDADSTGSQQETAASFTLKPSGCWLHPHTNSFLLHPLRYLKRKVLLSAAGVQDDRDCDLQYVLRLQRLIHCIQRDFGGWAANFLLALDESFDAAAGEPTLMKTGMYVPNDYMFRCVRAFPAQFFPCCSVHPYRTDAVQELARCSGHGAKLCKWHPISMNFNPADAKCDPFYATLKRLGMVLLSHSGYEHAIDPPGTNQAFGSPLLLRRPLDAGVKVIAAHCASEGYNTDIEDSRRPVVSNFSLLLRLMDDKRYEQLLFADISSTTAFLRVGTPLQEMLDRQDLHHRLVYGSDYPIPCVNIVVQTSKLKRSGYITDSQRRLLNVLYQVNPLLFDFVSKRFLRSAKGNAYSPCVFAWNRALFGPKNDMRFESALPLLDRRKVNSRALDS